MTGKGLFASALGATGTLGTSFFLLVPSFVEVVGPCYATDCTSDGLVVEE